jgi:tetratricopeptide (TPR) repeat protein
VLAAIGLGPARVAAGAGAGTESNLGLGASSCGIALGGAFAARVGDASALYWNPGRMASLERGAALVTHAPIGFGDATQTFAGVVYPTLGAGSFGLGMLRLATGDIQAFDAASRPQGTVGFAETALYLGWARGVRAPHLGRVEVGATLKTLTQSLGDWSSTGAGIDLGVAWRPVSHPELGVGFVVRDFIAPRVRLDQDADHAPATWQLATSWRPGFGRRIGLEMMGALDRVSTRGVSPRLGLECTYRSRLALRLGASRQGVAFGLGVTLQSFGFDYAYQSRASSHPVTLSAAWGRTLETRHAHRAAARAEALRSHLQSMLEARLATAQSAYDRGDYASALDEWKIVAGLDPTEERAQRGIEAAGGQLAAAQARVLADREQAAARTAQFELALRAYGQRDHSLAREIWLQLLDADPQNAEVQRYLDKTEQALRDEIGALSEQARRLQASGDYVGALAAWSRVHAADPRHPEAGPALERCRAALLRPRRNDAGERGDAATRNDAAARGASPEFRDALAAYAAGDLERAVTLLRAVRTADPGHAEAARLLAKAERQLRPLSPEDRARVRELYLRGMGHFTANQFEAAIAEWSRILELDPGNASIHENIRAARARLHALQP